MSQPVTKVEEGKTSGVHSTGIQLLEVSSKQQASQDLAGVKKVAAVLSRGRTLQLPLNQHKFFEPHDLLLYLNTYN